MDFGTYVFESWIAEVEVTPLLKSDWWKTTRLPAVQPVWCLTGSSDVAVDAPGRRCGKDLDQLVCLGSCLAFCTASAVKTLFFFLDLKILRVDKIQMKTLLKLFCLNYKDKFIFKYAAKKQWRGDSKQDVLYNISLTSPWPWRGVSSVLKRQSRVDKSSWLHQPSCGSPRPKAFCKGRMSIKRTSGKLHRWFHLSYGHVGILLIKRERLQQGSAKALCLIGMLDQISNTAANEAVRYCCRLPNPRLSDWWDCVRTQIIVE